MEQEPPTEVYEYVAPKRIGTCDKCKQGIYELATFKEQRFSTKSEGREWLRNYVEKRLRDSGVIPVDALYESTEGIVHSALRQGTHKLPNGKFASIASADFEIEWHIKCPPPPISRNRFSLRAFIKDNQP